VVTAADDTGDDNQRHTITAAEHRQPMVVAHRVWATVGYGSEGWGFESLRLRKMKAQVILPMTWAFLCLDQVSVSGCVWLSSARGG
jgi:hypothetical protein